MEDSVFVIVTGTLFGKVNPDSHGSTLTKSSCSSLLLGGPDMRRLRVSEVNPPRKRAFRRMSTLRRQQCFFPLHSGYETYRTPSQRESVTVLASKSSVVEQHLSYQSCMFSL